METQNTPVNLFERFNNWLHESISVKLFSIGVLVLILLLPSAWIQGLMDERQTRAEEVINEITEKWSGSQTLSGPILVIPYLVKKKVDHGNDGIEIQEHTENYFTMPETLHINGEVTPTVLHRGIFDAAVYTSSLDVQATFTEPDFKSRAIDETRVHWNDAYMIFAITDLRGISDNPVFTVGGINKNTEPSGSIGVSIQKFWDGQTNVFHKNDRDASANMLSDYLSNGIVAKLGWHSSEDFKSETLIKLKVKGSTRLLFIPTGKTTTVQVSGPWGNPSFEGGFLPITREVTPENFTASWKILHFNRPLPQSWTEENVKLSGAEFGVKLLIPVDQYQKSIRTAKYGHLLIILTFVALFLVEVIKKIRIHPFQYILLAAALIMYYTLLLSFAEQVGYTLAYVIASLSTVVLVGLYSFSFLKSKKLVLLFTGLLLVFYTFIFVIVMQQDFSLLIGSVGLFLIIAVLMYVSRNINWYKEN